MLTMQDIADMCRAAGKAHPDPERAYTTIRTWRSRGKLPEPAGTVGQSPWWTEASIRDWLKYVPTLADRHEYIEERDASEEATP